MSSKKLLQEVGRFIQDHPQGWNHDEWLGFLYELSQSGLDTSNEDGIGLALENERLRRTLAGLDIRGLGPKRIAALADHFGTLWNLMEAPEEAIRDVPGIPGTLAAQIHGTLQ